MNRTPRLLSTVLIAGLAFAIGLATAGLGGAATVSTSEVEPIDVPAVDDAAETAQEITRPTSTVPPTTVAPEPYPTLAPTTTVAAPIDPVEPREQLTRELVDALNAADLDRLEAIAAADPYADASMLSFLAESGPYWFEECFEVSGGVPMCNATSDMIGMTIGFTDDDTAIDLVGWAFASGV